MLLVYEMSEPTSINALQLNKHLVSGYHFSFSYLLLSLPACFFLFPFHVISVLLLTFLLLLLYFYSHVFIYLYVIDELDLIEYIITVVVVCSVCDGACNVIYSH